MFCMMTMLRTPTNKRQPVFCFLSWQIFKIFTKIFEEITWHKNHYTFTHKKHLINNCSY